MSTPTLCCRCCPACSRRHCSTRLSSSGALKGQSCKVKRRDTVCVSCQDACVRSLNHRTLPRVHAKGHFLHACQGNTDSHTLLHTTLFDAWRPQGQLDGPPLIRCSCADGCWTSSASSSPCYVAVYTPVGGLPACRFESQKAQASQQLIWG
jgi:hypothetical protein